MEKQKALILKASPCGDNLYPDGPKTTAEAKKIGTQCCPFFSRCHCLLKDRQHQCAMLFGTQIAVLSLIREHDVETEMKIFRSDMGEAMLWMARKGIIWSPNRKTFELIDVKNGIKKIERFARMVLK